MAQIHQIFTEKMYQSQKGGNVSTAFDLCFLTVEVNFSATYELAWPHMSAHAESADFFLGLY